MPVALEQHVRQRLLALLAEHKDAERNVHNELYEDEEEPESEDVRTHRILHTRAAWTRGTGL